ncbi:hypothetical protein [Gallaecimonas pentaromativorans]|uniref:hypothetical protein n=1 Tax=Gallaecimonas pentaromativorans TaxID=584787 RepID=UPI000F466DD3|nr:hypothetical protein [Gallaecimonas pentaromativorans]
MKHLLWIVALLSTFAQAGDEKIAIYLDFEKAYMSNDASSFSPWLGKEYKISETLHVPGMGSDTRPVSKRQLLASMEAVGKPSSMPRSTPENTVIESQDGDSFCATSTTLKKTIVGGDNYEEKEVRKVCFSKKGSKYLATSHNIDVYYRAL